jgi:hypothetical protein
MCSEEFRVQPSALESITPVSVAKTPNATAQIVTKSFSHASGRLDCSITALMPKTSAWMVTRTKANPIAIPIKVWLPSRAISDNLADFFLVSTVTLECKFYRVWFQTEPKESF